MLIKEREGIMAGSTCVPMDIVSGSIKVILKKEFSNSDDPE